MKINESIDTLKKIQAVSSEMPILEKTKKGYGYNYTPLDEIMKHIRPLLVKNKLFLGHYTTRLKNGNNVLHTICLSLTAKDEQPITSSSEMKPAELAKMNKYQAEGSALTYYRRYHISMIFGLTSNEDNDAKTAKVKIQATSKETSKTSNEKYIKMFSDLLSKTSMTGDKIKRHYDSQKNNMSDDLANKIKELINSKFKLTIKD